MAATAATKPNSVPENNREVYAILFDCNDCGHCVDLHTPNDDDPAVLKEGRAKIVEIIRKWLSEPF